MAVSNRERVGKGLDLLASGLRPFVERELKAKLGDGWGAALIDSNTRPSKGKTATVNLNDPQVLLGAMIDKWQDVFRDILGQQERSLVHELKTIRNSWAHNEQFSSNDTIRALDSTERLLCAVSASEAASEVNQMRMDVMRTMFDDHRRQEMRKKSFQPTEGKPQGGLKPWREVVTPHPDVASGRYQQAEFAADLWQVYQKEGSDEYKHPTEFFRRTFITEGLRRLLSQAILRLAGTGGDPVVELQTNFGGGKTHSMLALYHLFSGTSSADLPGADELVKEVGLSLPKNVRRAVFVGTQISPGKPHKKPDGTTVRTLWGELAWQIGGKEGYKLVKEDDEKATNPGNSLKELFNKFGPCLILIDEWVAYARQLHGTSDLPAGTFETQFTFAQALSEAAKAAKQTLLVVSIPASESPHQKESRGVTDIEVGGERGREALARLKNAVGRVEASWRPASPDEGFEIVRRRLFQPLSGEQFVARDAVARAFVDLYGAQQQEFPNECREADYERRMKMAYPIHPELFDRLYNDWSTLDKFQRTRGVLRLMAAVIHSLWERQDSNLLIMPGTVPVDDQIVQFELTRYLEDQWVPVIEKDVDGSNSLPLSLDRDNPNLGRYSAARRVARTIYMGSAPTTRTSHRGIDERQVKLGCVQPGEAVATFGDALRRLTDSATYLYVDGKRYWYSTQPTVARLADDRAGQLTDDQVSDEIVKRLREEARTRADFSKVHACVPSSDVPDDTKEVRLVILGPDYPHSNKDDKSAARREAAAILEARGTSPRNYKNTLVFLAGDANRLRELEQAVKQFLAWSSIWDERVSLNLDQFQTRQAETKRKSANEAVDLRIGEAYHWLLVPGQPDPKGEVTWTDLKLQGQDSLATRAAKKLKNEESLLVQMGGVRLRTELDRVPLWTGNHVSIKQLAEYMARYLYLPRLRDEQVLIAAIQEGVASLAWQTDTFAYAEGWDEQKKRYLGLRAASAGRVMVDDRSLLVKPDVAAAQIAKDEEAGARELAIRSYLPSDILQSQPETLASNLFRVIRVPEALFRFHSSKPITDADADAVATWAFRQVGPKHFLSFHRPPDDIAKQFGIKAKGGATRDSVKELDGVPVEDLVKELIKKSLYAECRRRGLCFCPDRQVVYFPFGLLKNDHLRFRQLDGQKTFFNAAGERTHGKGDRARKFLYHIVPVFAPKELGTDGYEIITRIRLRLTDKDGKLFSGRASNARRKKICKNWWNEEWLARTMGVMQFLANGHNQIVLGNSQGEQIAIDPEPRTWTCPVRLNEDALAEAIAIREEEEPHMRSDEEEEDDDE